MTIPSPIRHVLSAPRVSQVERFAEVAYLMPDQLYWRLAGHIWKHTAPYFYAALWHQLLTSPRPCRSHFARIPADRALWEQMPERFTCFRGHGPENRNGYFFSLSYSIAKGFANWHGDAGQVQVCLFEKADCIFWGGTQQEVICVPRFKSHSPFPAWVTAGAYRLPCAGA